MSLLLFEYDFWALLQHRLINTAVFRLSSNHRQHLEIRILAKIKAHLVVMANNNLFLSQAGRLDSNNEPICICFPEKTSSRFLFKSCNQSTSVHIQETVYSKYMSESII